MRRVHPEAIMLTNQAAVNAAHPLIEDPYTEFVASAYGAAKNGTVEIYNVRPLTTAFRRKEEVEYSDTAERRVRAFDTLLARMNRSGRLKRFSSRHVGHVHAHPHSRRYVPEPSRHDFATIRKAMEAYGRDWWIELILQCALIEPDGADIVYVRPRKHPEGKRPRRRAALRITSEEDGLGLRVKYTGHYIYRSGNELRRRELPVYFHEWR